MACNVVLEARPGVQEALKIFMPGSNHYGQFLYIQGVSFQSLHSDNVQAQHHANVIVMYSAQKLVCTFEKNHDPDSSL